MLCDTGAYEVGAAAPPAPITSATTITITYGYDKLYRLTSATYTDGKVFTYTYDSVGNRLTQQTLTQTTVYTYDLANRLTNVGPITYTWDANGNLLNDGVYTYTYDAADRLITTTQGANTYTFKYNGLGDRVKQTASGVVTTYTLDLNAGLTQVLADGTNTYLYGLMRIGEQQPGGFAYHLPDALGSVRQLANASGSVTLAKNYEPYGNVLSSAGSGSSVFAFAGEQYDASTNLLYLRARYYSGAQGRFISRDTWADYQQPLSLNGWAYVEGNPINRVDPSGRWSCIGHADCNVWVENALNMLNASGETGRRIVSFFRSYDSQLSKDQTYYYNRASEYYGRGCSNPLISLGAVIKFSDMYAWGSAVHGSVLELRNSPEIIDGPIPTTFGVIVFGHEISHWKQGIERFSLQGEVLGRFVERQLQRDLRGQEDPITVRVSQVYPFSYDGLREARKILDYDPLYRNLPLIILGLGPIWLQDLAVPIPPPSPMPTGTPAPPVPTPMPQPIPTPP